MVTLSKQLTKSCNSDFQNLMSEKTEPETGLKCDGCESTNATECMCPYDQEIHGVDTLVCLCDDCYKRTCEDI
jgi:hypothetical protein